MGMLNKLRINERVDEYRLKWLEQVAWSTCEKTGYEGKYYSLDLRDGKLQEDLHRDGQISMGSQWAGPTVWRRR
jgi:hypothetical protein